MYISLLLHLSLSKTGATIAMVVHVLDDASATRKDKLLVLSAHGASNMQENDILALTLIKDECSLTTNSTIYKLWCGLNLLDLMIKRNVNLIQDEGFIKTLRKLTSYLRK